LFLLFEEGGELALLIQSLHIAVTYLQDEIGKTFRMIWLSERTADVLLI
jgi:hypothetical protein